MQEHSQYEGLCAAAAVGQISAEELAELQAHVQVCDSCRDLQMEFVEINSVWLTQAREKEFEAYDSQSTLRNSILCKLEQSGAKFSESVRNEVAQRHKKDRKFGFAFLNYPSPLWAAAMVLVAVAVGFGFGSLRHSATPDKIVIGAAPAPVVLENQATALPVRNNRSDAAAQAEADLQQKLANSEAVNHQLKSELERVAQQITFLQDARNQAASQLAQLKAAAEQSQAATAMADLQLRSLKDAQTFKDAELTAAQNHLNDLEGKLAEQSAALERDRQVAALASNSEVQDVIGSPYLHVIDVADVDNNGVRKPFGRMFYTQGKSLIFYAYNLVNTKDKQTFYAWGQKEGDPSATRVLGALVKVDEGQGRWVFRYNDQKVLAHIDSVSITLEPNRPTGGKPRGERLLLAYLGAPANHP